jgi:type IV pilus assembly protein PilV
MNAIPNAVPAAPSSAARHPINAPMKVTPHLMNTPRRHRCTSGFTLVEVLVSLLVISIGLLGVAKLVLAAMKANDSAYFRGQATNLAYAILDDIRANRAALLVTPGYQVAYGPDAEPATLCTAGVVCNPTQQAAYDVWVWKCRLSAANNNVENACNPSGVTLGALPSGDGQIVLNNIGNQWMATITVRWDDSVAAWAFGTPAAAAPDPMTFTLETGL